MDSSESCLLSNLFVYFVNFQEHLCSWNLLIYYSRELVRYNLFVEIRSNPAPFQQILMREIEFLCSAVFKSGLLTFLCANPLAICVTICIIFSFFNGDFTQF